jgi:ACS family sodium-dependent inorganic phosphate cotransporter-like MFS transporter 5
MGNFGFIEGCPFGTAATMICSGYIIESSLGWPSVFYVTGIVTILWSGVWLIFASNTPTECMIISQGERDYICKSIGPIKSSSVRDYVSICIYRVLSNYVHDD